jgi:hypothetical protein
MKDQWDFLVGAFNNCTLEAPGDVKFYNHLLVGGPPGTGKSSTTWLWCQWMARSQNEPVLWMHKAHGPGSSFSICILDSEGVHTLELVATSQLDTHVLAVLHQSQCRVVVFDGITATDDVYLKSTVEGWLNQDRCNRLLVYCASVAVRLKAEAGARHHGVPSWAIDDYASACLLDSFWGNVEAVMDASAFEGNDDDAVDNGAGALSSGLNDGGAPLSPSRRVCLESKFFIAGHCARWMFGLLTSDVLKDIQVHIEKVDSIASLLDNDMGESALRQINHLRATLASRGGRESGNTFVSEYVARTLSQRGDVDVKFMVSLNAFANRSGNRTFVGWCVEFDFLMQLRKGAEAAGGGAIKLILEDTSEVSWSVNRCLWFDKVTDVAALADLAAGDWLIPRRFNQGTFDAVQLVEEIAAGAKRRTVRFVNVTCAERHDLKSTYFFSMMQALVESGWLSRPPKPSLEFFFVRPIDQKDAGFVSTEPTPHGALTKSFSWPNRQRNEAFFSRSS